MKLNKNNYIVIILALISLTLLFLVLNYSEFLFKHGYFIECFTSNVALYKDTGSPTTSHSVDLPLTTTYSCTNFCGPTARCAKTGQQCFTDIDCPGCQPVIPQLSKSSANNVSVPGNNGAGKLTWGVTPQYSPLTSGYGTREKIITKDMFSRPAMPDLGINTWLSAFNKERKLYDTRYKPPQLPYMPNYPKRYSFTGEFIEDGPLASNAVL
jgi:hypothetical protein